MGLPGPCLPVGQHCHVVPAEQLLQDVPDGGGVQLLVGALGSEGEVVGETFLSVRNINLKAK